MNQQSNNLAMLNECHEIHHDLIQIEALTQGCHDALADLARTEIRAEVLVLQAIADRLYDVKMAHQAGYLALADAQAQLTPLEFFDILQRMRETKDEIIELQALAQLVNKALAYSALPATRSEITMVQAIADLLGEVHSALQAVYQVLEDDYQQGGAA